MSTLNIDKKANFLATCLLESLEDEDLRAAKLFLEKYECCPNTIIYGRGIAPIHYACGMENLAIAEEVVEQMLSCGGDPNVRSEDDMTPLHVACLTGRSQIVKMLLQHGGDIHLTDAERKTPVLYAVQEHHLEVIQAIQNFMFEMKFANKKQEFLVSANTLNCQSPRNKNLLSVQQLEETKYTPNRVHYNFDVTSPYYIYITHRKTNSKQQTLPVDLSEMPMPSPIPETKENLFKLTEENLDRFSDQLSPVKSRMSLIQVWREKVQKSRQRSSILRVFNNIDALLDGFIGEETLNFTNTVLEPKQDQSEKPKNNKAFTNFLENLVVHDMQEELSFVTAEDNMDNINGELNESNFIKSPQGSQYVMQVAETYAHTDDENGIVFYETRLHSNAGGKSQDLNKSKDSASINISLPPDYDTDALRTELTTFGEPPGPITKHTKRLYIKRLIKYKRNISANANIDGAIDEHKFSIELERTVGRKDFFDRIHEHLPLEREVNEHFNVSGPKRKFREGTMKTSFIYFLIDPRVSKNLPGEFKYMSQHDVWRRFLNAIFYVGKGKSSRPYSHLYDAMKLFSRNREQLKFDELPREEDCGAQSPERIFHLSQKQVKESKKLQRILDIWESKRGVVCLHVFHNIMPAEAYTREAAIIDALGLKHLTNMKRGDYYGPCQTWTMRSKKFLGIALLFKAMQIFLAEGESQLTPSDLI